MNTPSPTSSPEKVTVAQTVDAPPDEVAAAIVSPNAMPAWLCDEARIEKRAGGRLLCAWNGGDLRTGRFTDYAPPRRIAWRWRGEADTGYENVTFDLTAEGAATRVVVTADAGGGAAAGPSWATVLDNLAVHLATGRNARLARRPMLGVTPDFGAGEGGPAGALLGAPLPDGGAANAGVRAGDRLLRLGDRAIGTWQDIGVALDQWSAGDTVPITLWRDGAEVVLDVTLGSRAVPDLPATPDDVRAHLASNTERWFAALESALDGVTDDEAAWTPAPGEWSVKQVLVHLIIGERFGHDWLTSLAGDDHPPEWASSFEVLEAAFAGLTLRDLRARFEGDARLSNAMTEHLLATSPAPRLFHPLADSARTTFEHLDEHLEQIRTIVAAARAG
jgi:uncharacterized protein YndB with AHSA1/START domain